MAWSVRPVIGWRRKREADGAAALDSKKLSVLGGGISLSSVADKIRPAHSNCAASKTIFF